MKRIAAFAIAAIALTPLTTPLNAQAPVDIGIHENGDMLEVTLRPRADFRGILSAVVFTVRWEKSSGATLGRLVQEGPAARYIPITRSGPVRENGPLNYQVFAGFGMQPMSESGATWVAGEEYVIATIPVQGKATVELANDPWTRETEHNADYYLSLGGVDQTGTIYKSVANIEEGGVSVQPNPNNGVFTFRFGSPSPTDLRVEVVNTLGQSVFTDAVTGFEGNYEREMDISSMGKGTYYLKVERGDKSSVHKVVYR